MQHDGSRYLGVFGISLFSISHIHRPAMRCRAIGAKENGRWRMDGSHRHTGIARRLRKKRENKRRKEKREERRDERGKRKERREEGKEAYL